MSTRTIIESELAETKGVLREDLTTTLGKDRYDKLNKYITKRDRALEKGKEPADKLGSYVEALFTNLDAGVLESVCNISSDQLANMEADLASQIQVAINQIQDKDTRSILTQRLLEKNFVGKRAEDFLKILKENVTKNLSSDLKKTNIAEKVDSLCHFILGTKSPILKLTSEEEQVKGLGDLEKIPLGERIQELETELQETPKEKKPAGRPKIEKKPKKVKPKLKPEAEVKAESKARREAELEAEAKAKARKEPVAKIVEEPPEKKSIKELETDLVDNRAKLIAIQNLPSPTDPVKQAQQTEQMQNLRAAIAAINAELELREPPKKGFVSPKEKIETLVKKAKAKVKPKKVAKKPAKKKILLPVSKSRLQSFGDGPRIIKQQIDKLESCPITDRENFLRIWNAANLTPKATPTSVQSVYDTILFTGGPSVSDAIHQSIDLGKYVNLEEWDQIWPRYSGKSLRIILEKMVQKCG